jgi:integrase
VQYLKELQVQAEHRGAGDTAPQRVTARVPRERYVYLTRREVDLLFDQIADLRDRALFGTMYYFGLRASEVGLLLREYVNFRTRRIYIPRLKGGVPGEKVMTADCRRLLQSYLQSRRDALPYVFPPATLARSVASALMPCSAITPSKLDCRHTSVIPTACATPLPPISLTPASRWSTCRII